MAVPPAALDAGPCAILKGKLPIFNAQCNGHGFTAELLGQVLVTVAGKPSQELAPGTLGRILRQVSLSKEAR